MPFFGPFSLGTANPQEAGNQLRQFGASGIASFPGTGGSGVAGLGFTHPGPVLFQGQPLSNTSSINTAPPLATSSIAGQPESITALLAGLSIPSIPSLPAGSPVATATNPGGRNPLGNLSVGDSGGVTGGPGPGASSSSATSSGLTGNNGLGTVNRGGILGDIGDLSMAVNNASLVGRGLNAITNNGLSDAITGPVAGIINAALPNPLGLMSTAFGLFATPPEFTDTVGLDQTIKGLEGMMGIEGENNATLGDNTTGPIGQTTIVGFNGDPAPGTPGDAPGPPGSPGTSPGPSAAGNSDPGSPGSGDGGGGGGGTVICTALYRRGLVDDVTMAANNRFRRTMHPEAYQGYLTWAVPIVRLAESSPLIFSILWFVFGGLIRAYMREINTPGSSTLGKVLLKIGVPLCHWIGHWNTFTTSVSR